MVERFLVYFKKLAIMKRIILSSSIAAFLISALTLSYLPISG